MTQKQHKPGCKANMRCLVNHPDGICPGPYGQCTCDSIKESEYMPDQEPKPEWKEKFENSYVKIALCGNPKLVKALKSFIRNAIAEAVLDERNISTSILKRWQMWIEANEYKSNCDACTRNARRQVMQNEYIEKQLAIINPKK